MMMIRAHSAFASCACPGVVGTTLGAGLGPLQGRRGLMIDALESVRLVTADGHLVTVSKTENSDLFWGIRGAGSNFGIVTSATYKPYNITNGGQAMVKQMIFTTAVNNSYFQILKDLDSTLPPEMSLTNVAYWNTDYNMVGIFYPGHVQVTCFEVTYLLVCSY